MKKSIITLILLLAIIILHADKVKLITTENAVITAQLLFGTDSLPGSKIMRKKA